MFLTPNDFDSRNGELIKLNDQGYSFVFFFTNDCVWCSDVKPAFNYLSKIIRGVNFAYMDVDQNNRQLIDVASRTNMPIKYVPLLLLFANGRLVAQFLPDEDNPQNNILKMKHFITTNTNKQPQSTKIRGVTSSQLSAIPPYSLGIPGNLASRKVCKLYNNAYTKS